MEASAISNVDRLVLLLRERIAQRSKAAPRRDREAAGRTTPAAMIREMAAVEDLDERHLRRTLIQNLLLDAFGQKVVYDAQFQQVVDRVTQTIEADPAGGQLLQRMVRELKAEAAG